MARTHSSSLMLGEALGISPVQIRKWRGGARPVPEHHLDKIEAFFRERGARPPETPRTIDPREIPQAPVSHRVTITARDDPLPPANAQVDPFVAPCSLRRVLEDCLHTN